MVSIKKAVLDTCQLLCNCFYNIILLYSLDFTVFIVLSTVAFIAHSLCSIAEPHINKKESKK